MKKANAPETQPGTVVVTAPALDRVKMYLKFPINLNDRKAVEEVAKLERTIPTYEQNVTYHADQLKQAEGGLRNTKLKLHKMRKDMPEETVASLEDMKRSLEEVAALPWVQEVRIVNGWLIVRTRKNALQTTFDQGVVDLGGGEYEVEFIEPVTAPMPQYDIYVELANLGLPMSNKADRLQVRLIDEYDVSHFTAGKVMIQAPFAHWGSNGNPRLGDVQDICFGDYETDIMEAAVKGLVPLMTEIAVYLQISDDGGNAYRTKYEWGMQIGKKEYEFLLRKVEKGETRGDIQAKFKQDFKRLRQPENAKEPGARGATRDIVRDFFNDRMAQTVMERNPREVPDIGVWTMRHQQNFAAIVEEFDPEAPF